MLPDEPNISDAILLALHDAGWIGALTLKTTDRHAPKPKRPPRERVASSRRYYPVPAGIVVPKLAYWSATNNRFDVRISIGHRTYYVLNFPPTQAGADAAAEASSLARAIRTAGCEDIDEIRRRVRAMVQAVREEAT